MTSNRESGGSLTYSESDFTPHTAICANIEDDEDDGASARSVESDYDRCQRHLLQQSVHANNGGWKEELRRYLNDIPPDVNKDLDIVSWWAVGYFPSSVSFFVLNYSTRYIQKNIRLLHASLRMCAPFRQLPCHASGCSLRVQRLPQIAGLVSAQRSLSISRS